MAKPKKKTEPEVMEKEELIESTDVEVVEEDEGKLSIPDVSFIEEAPEEVVEEIIDEVVEVVNPMLKKFTIEELEQALINAGLLIVHKTADCEFNTVGLTEQQINSFKLALEVYRAIKEKA